MQNLHLAPDEEGDDLYAGFELNEGLWNVSLTLKATLQFASPVCTDVVHHSLAPTAPLRPLSPSPGGVGYSSRRSWMRTLDCRRRYKPAMASGRLLE